MKITSFNPLIMTKQADDLIKLFEELGFEVRHKKKNPGSDDIIDVRMRSEEGFHVDVAPVDRVPQDVTAIRVNVDDFDEAYNFLIEKGFKNIQGDKISETPSAVGTAMMSPSGFIIALSHHIKDHD